jgi:hypothetical protein
MDNLPVYKIDINEFDESGIELISLVMNPAIMLKGLAFAEVNLPPCHDFCKCEIIDNTWVFGASDTGPCEYCVSNKNQFDRDRKTFDIQFNEEKQIIAGPAIIPDFKIYRYDEELGEYYVTFTREVIEKMVEKFNKQSVKDPINIDHSDTIAPAFIKGSWIVENSEFDKSRMYGFELPEGTWFLEVKVTDSKFWNEEIKKKGKFGFSIEGLMGLSLSSMIKPLQEQKELNFESYNDYPQAASDNAERALRIRDENPNLSCGTQVGWVRANQLANRENISEETIARMSSFQRHYENSKGNPTEDCGALMWLAWGGTEGIEWASSKLERIRTEIQDKERLMSDKLEFTTDETDVNKNKINKTEKMKKRLKFAEYTLQDGTTRISVDGELAVGSACYVVLEDGTLEQAPEGEHTLENGTTIFVDAEGFINEVRSAETTAVAEGEQALAVTPEEVTAIITEVMNILEPRFEEMRTIIAELSTRVETLESHEVEPISVDENMEKFSRVELLNSLKVKLEALTPLNKNK